MAIAPSLLTGGGGTSVSSQATASVTVAANALGLVWVASIQSPGTPEIPTISGWTLVVTAVNGSIRGTLLRSMTGSDRTGALTIDFAAVTQNALRWQVIQVTGVSTSGTNGAGAVVQSASTTGATVTTLTVTLSAFADAAHNMGMGFFDTTGSTSTIVPWSGYTELSEGSQANLDEASIYKATEDTSVDATFTSAVLCLALAVELAAQKWGPLLAGQFTHFVRDT